MLSPKAYLQKVLKGIIPIEPRSVELDSLEILDTVLAQPLVARLPVPPFTNAAMDGFALSSQVLPDVDTVLTLPVHGDIPAGSTPPVKSVQGVYRIMTGAPLPADMDTVVKIEDTDAAIGPGPVPQTISFSSAVVRPGMHVRRCGEDISCGEEVLSAGSPVNPGVVSVAASLGYSRLRVRGPVSVGVISTGNELRDCNQVARHLQQNPSGKIPEGIIPDSNSLLLQGLTHSFGGRVVFRRQVGDRPNELVEAYQHALECGVELVLTSGGISTGAYDVVKEVGLTQGMHFHRLAIKPGKPQGYGLLGGTNQPPVPVLMLPGNPLAVLTSFHLFARPVLATLQGDREFSSPLLPAADHLPEYGVASSAWSSPQGKLQAVPVKILPPESVGPQLLRSGSSGGGHARLSALFQTQALALIPPEQCRVNLGDRLEIYRL